MTCWYLTKFIFLATLCFKQNTYLYIIHLVLNEVDIGIKYWPYAHVYLGNKCLDFTLVFIFHKSPILSIYQQNFFLSFYSFMDYEAVNQLRCTVDNCLGPTELWNINESCILLKAELLYCTLATLISYRRILILQENL